MSDDDSARSIIFDALVSHQAHRSEIDRCACGVDLEDEHFVRLGQTWDALLAAHQVDVLMELTSILICEPHRIYSAAHRLSNGKIATVGDECDSKAEALEEIAEFQPHVPDMDVFMAYRDVVHRNLSDWKEAER